MSWGHGGFAPYVSVAEKRRRAERQAQQLTKKGKALRPIALAGRVIAQSFWGKAWCDNLESYSDYENRLPRGRSYVRNGSVLHLDIQRGAVEALVSGTSLYKVKIGIAPVAAAKWNALCRECAGTIGSLMELLQGRLSERVMGVMTRRESGLFPAPSEIELHCSCPDWAGMCKHVAAALYGVGARLDEKPELLFTLRHADHAALVSQADTVTALTEGKPDGAAPTLDARDVRDVFGIDLDTSAQEPAPVRAAEPPVGAPVVPSKKRRGRPAETSARAQRKRTGKRPAKRKRRGRRT